MAWKIERWLDEVFPGKERIYAEYRGLAPRELAVVAAAVIDLALAELLAKRLNGQPREIEEFLGLDGDGRAPSGAFGARIQLAVLVGILSPLDASILRTLKEIRNHFAHRVRINFLSPPVLKATTRLHSLWLENTEALIKTGAINGTTEKIKELGKHLPRLPEAGEGLLLSVFTVYQAYFHLMHNRIERIGNALLQPQE